MLHVFKSFKQADEDPSSWLRPGWEWKTALLQNAVKCMGCGYEMHRNQSVAIIKHEGSCNKFQGLL